MLCENIFWHQESGKYQQFQEASTDLPTTDLLTYPTINWENLCGWKAKHQEKGFEDKDTLKIKESYLFVKMDHCLVLPHSFLFCISVLYLPLMSSLCIVCDVYRLLHTLCSMTHVIRKKYKKEKNTDILLRCRYPFVTKNKQINGRRTCIKLVNLNYTKAKKMYKTSSQLSPSLFL